LILARITKAIREQNWFAVVLEFIIVVAGVYSAVWIEGHQSREAERQQTAEVIETLRGDLLNSGTVERRFITTIDAGLEEWTAAYEAGERPSPYYFRIPGSDTAPTNTWETLLSMGVGEVFRPDLVFDLAFFFTERQGVGRRYVRYVEFVEDEILPFYGTDTSVFYLENGQLRPEFAANLERLREYRNEAESLIIWSNCLNLRLESPRDSELSCSRDFLQAVDDGETARLRDTNP